MIDGPGNRMVIFFQGCQFNCLYCHNPHTIGECNLCGTCVDICPTKSLKIHNQQLLHETATCIKCDECIKQCPENSSPFYKQYSVEKLIAEILPIRDFISGITLSGGEVMLQYEFVEAFFKAIRNHDELKGLSLFIDSNGDVPQKYWDALLSYTDGFMIDLKADSSNTHKQITGCSNSAVLESIKYLDSKEKLYEVRTVIVSNFHHNPQEIDGLKKIYQSLSRDVRKVFIRMRTHGIREEYQHLLSPSDDEMNKIAFQICENPILI